jgi:hypothetical protein
VKEKVRISGIKLSQNIDRLQFQELNIDGTCQAIINGKACEAKFSCLWNDSPRVKIYCPPDYRKVMLTKYPSELAALFAFSKDLQREIEKEIKEQLPCSLREAIYDTGFLSKVYAQVKKDRHWQLTPSREEFLKETTPPQIKLKYVEKYKGLNIGVFMPEFRGKFNPKCLVYSTVSELPFSNCYWQAQEYFSPTKAAKEALKFIRASHRAQAKEPPRQQTMSLENSF